MMESTNGLLPGLAPLASWSPWLPFEPGWRTAPQIPGVYLARDTNGTLVYAGKAGERRGQGLRGRLRVYASGKAAVSGLGEAALDRALADLEWLQERLAEVQCGKPMRATLWAAAAITRANLEIAWATVETGEAAKRLERQVLNVLDAQDLWNRAR